MNQKPFFFKYVHFENLAPLKRSDFKIVDSVLDCTKQNRISFDDVRAVYDVDYQRADFGKNSIMILTPNSILNTLNPAHLRELCLKRNQIEYVQPNSLASLINLEKLDLSHNCISHLSKTTFQKCPNLVDIDLSHNRIDYMRTTLFAPLKKLQRICLDHNTISLLAKTTFANQKELKFLDLSHNKLHDIKTEFFQNLSNLQMLMLNDNLIYYVQNNSFRNCTNLQVLCLHGNRISFLDDRVLNGFKSKLHLPITVTLYDNNGFYLDNRTYRKDICVDILNVKDIKQMNVFVNSKIFDIIKNNMSSYQIVKLFLSYYMTFLEKE